MNYAEDDQFAPNEKDLELLAKSLAEYDSPKAVKAREEKRMAEFKRGAMNGWWDEDGQSINADENEDEDEDEDED